MAVSPELKQAVKEALIELEADKQHQKVHDYIYISMLQKLEAGQKGFSKCGICKETLTVQKAPELEAAE